MSGQAYDFTGYEVLVVGGTSGTGHALARGFASAGAHVTVTGTLMLRELYDEDLSGLDYEMVNLARQDSIDNLVSTVRHLDVLVLAAGCNLPYGLPEGERAFIAEAVRSGVLGPMFLTTRLRLKLSQSPAIGGGCVVNTGSVRRWLELWTPSERSGDELAAATARSGDSWAGIGVRINSVLEAPRGLLPRQAAWAPEYSARRASSDTLLRGQQPRLQDAVVDLSMYLAGPSGARITGQTIRVS
jgi:3-oxoacyl-[acyl-carrier protein] reductase